MPLFHRDGLSNGLLVLRIKLQLASLNASEHELILTVSLHERLVGVVRLTLTNLKHLLNPLGIFLNAHLGQAHDKLLTSRLRLGEGRAGDWHNVSDPFKVGSLKSDH